MKAQGLAPPTIDLDSWADRHVDFREDPVGFCEIELGVKLWKKQGEILRALVESQRVMVKSANSVGKSFVMAVAALWFFLTRDPSETILTAPTDRQVNEITWGYVRRLYGDRPGIYPKSAKIFDHDEHKIIGFTASKENKFQGHHAPSIFVMFEEATGIPMELWDAARGMLAGGDTYWLAILNPTDPSSPAFIDEMSGGWHVMSISAFEHPNILAQLTGGEAVIPGAVELDPLIANMDRWGDWLSVESDVEVTDVDLFDPATYGVDELTDEQLDAIETAFASRWWRPGPQGEARVLGRYPSQAATSIFSEAAMLWTERHDLELRMYEPIVIGCDVARFGDDATSVHVRRGNVSVDHFTYYKQDTAHTAGVLKETARKWVEGTPQLPERVPIVIDDEGVGGGVVDQREGFNFIGVKSSLAARADDDYPNVRSELLFDLAERFKSKTLSTMRLPRKARDDLRKQAIGITYEIDFRGRRKAESKDDMKKRLGRSPDDLDAMALAYYVIGRVDRRATTVKVAPRNLDSRTARRAITIGRK